MITNRLANQSAVIRICPGCGYHCLRLNENDIRINCWKCTSDKARKFDFCWSCLKEWKNNRNAVVCGNLECGGHTNLFNYLANCNTKMLNGIECPSRRACPKCLMLVEHTKQCKHMECPNKSCKYNFCFMCLQHYPCRTGPNEACSLAPRQQTISPLLPPPTPPTSSCSIQ